MGDTGDLRLRGYVVQRLLGRGASGDVWRAQVAGSGDPVALKRIWTADAQAAQRARTEAALLTELDHPHLVRLHALIPTDVASVLVLDLADGGSLAQLLSARGRLAPGEVITAIAAVGAALAYLHANGVVHGDVSAANILFLPDGSPLLSDVGVARLVGDVAEVYSTAAYVDPAVAAGCVPGPPSDVFMLAAVAMHALTGRPPWAGGSAPDTLALAARGRLDDLAERFTAAGVPEPMAAVLRRALSVDPHRRGSAADLALDLRHSGEPIAVELGAGRARTDASAAAPARAAGPRHAAGPVRPTRGRGRGGRPVGAGLERGRAGSARGSGPARLRPPGTRGRLGRRRSAAHPAGRAAAAAGDRAATGAAGPRPVRVARGTDRDRGDAGGRAGGRWCPVGCRGRVAPARGGARSPRGADRCHRRRLCHRGGEQGADLVAGELTTRAPQLGSAAHRLRSAGRSALLPCRRCWTGSTPPERRPSPPATRSCCAGCTCRAHCCARTPRCSPGSSRPAAVSTGARTTYSALRIAGHAGRYTVTATASLAASRLVCEGRALGSAPRAGPATLRLELADTRDGPRIATQRVS